MNTEQGQKIADGFKRGRFPRWLSSILPSVGGRGSTPAAAGVEAGPPWARLSTDHRSPITLFSLLALLLAAFAPRAEAGVAASGETMSSYLQNGTNYIVHTFTTPGSNNLNITTGGTVEYLVVAGGGGGGANRGAGGGAGGYLTGTTNLDNNSSCVITVGGGGAGGLAGSSDYNVARGKSGTNVRGGSHGGQGGVDGPAAPSSVTYGSATNPVFWITAATPPALLPTTCTPRPT